MDSLLSVYDDCRTAKRLQLQSTTLEEAMLAKSRKGICGLGVEKFASLQFSSMVDNVTIADARGR